MVSVNLHGLRPTRVTGIRRVSELREWSGGFIGAGVTTAGSRSFDARAAGRRTVGSPRSAAPEPSAETSPPPVLRATPSSFLAAVDAAVVLRSATGERTVPWDEFITGPACTTRRPVS